MLVGRDAEIAALDALFSNSVQGRGTIAVISGPVATGKTTLLHTLKARAAASGAFFLSAVGSRGERELPLGIVDQLLRSGSLPRTVAPQVARIVAEHEVVTPPLLRIFDELLKLFTELSAGSPVVIAVDDMQHADSTSLQYFSYLARRMGTARIFLVFTERTQVLPVDRLVRAEILRQGNCHGIALTSLPLSGVTKLLGEHLDSVKARSLAPACHLLTGGNPLLINALAEDYRAAGDEPPAGLVPGNAFRTAVVTCLHRYEPALAELAHAVAVLGESATPALLGELLETGLDPVTRGIDTLTAAGLLQSGRFRHEAARQAVLEYMTASERGAMHARAARALYWAGAASAVLAGHVMAADRIGAGWTVTVLQEAAARALTDGEPDRALGYLRRAEIEFVDDRQRATTRFAAARAEWRVDPERAVWHMAELAADARAGWLDSECLSKLAYYLFWAGHTDHASEVLAVLEEASGSSAQRADIRSALRFLYPDATFRGTERSWLAPARGGSEDTVSSAERILQERGEDDEDTLALVTTALMALLGEDRLDRAAFWCSTLRRESEGHDSSPFLDAVLTGFWAMIETRRGNLPAAESNAHTALNLLTKKGWGVAIGKPLSSLLLTAIATGRHSDAAAYLRVPVPEAMFGTAYGLLYLCARGEYYLATGRAAAALTDFQACGDRMVMWGLDWPGLVPWRIKAAEAYVAMGDKDTARGLSNEQLAQVGSRSSRTRGISLRVLALTSAPSKRIALLRESAEVLRDCGARLELAYTFTELSNAHVAVGDHDRAQWAARQARNLMERCGSRAPSSLERRERDREADERRFTQLSNAERRVAVLAAYGYTNYQIAKKLYITVSTVEQHLTRVYRKLGVSGRIELPIEV
jgi:DNA-binding CsgD family transcriptional regulator